MSKILDDIKASLGDQSLLGEEFDKQIIELINITLLSLTQVGCVYISDLEIDESTEWDEIIVEPPSKNNIDQLITTDSVTSAVKAYIGLQVRILFDPPVSTIVNIMQEKSNELLWRLEVAYHVN